MKEKLAKEPHTKIPNAIKFYNFLYKISPL